MNPINTEIAIQVINNKFNTLKETKFFLWQEQFIENQEAAGCNPNDIIEMLHHIAYLIGLNYSEFID
jgi:hypothetical protein